MQKLGDWCEFDQIHENICQIDDILCEFDQIHGEIRQIEEIFESGIGFSPQGGGINFSVISLGKKYSDMLNMKALVGI